MQNYFLNFRVGCHGAACFTQPGSTWSHLLKFLVPATSPTRDRQALPGEADNPRDSQRRVRRRSAPAELPDITGLSNLREQRNSPGPV